MITRIVKAKINPDNRSNFKKYIEEFIIKSQEFTDNHHADCFEDLEFENHFHIYTIWKSEKALENFRSSALNKEFKNNLIKWSEKRYSAWTVQNMYNK